MTHYSLRARQSVSEPPQCWVVYGSMNGHEWLEIAREDDTLVLRGWKAVRTFKVARLELCRYIQILDYAENAQLDVDIIEIFGYLVD
jgi:hypothetical protein